ncbi:NAD(P)-binding domain-containing protein [Bosea sp. 117]|uniref:NAD(P)-dependent oxidoreductase n=1 Tax=Bosea sp. 117 TaxID=1125973 RepID=UPI0006907BE5|nr:NAD(P)-binding domain-containing protein [Bosea sp. 117]
MPSSVSLLGLGSMGSSLARALIAAGIRPTLWNRSPARAAPFADTADLAGSIVEAAGRSDLVIACLINYAATWESLDRPEVIEALKGRTLVQLATGLPAEATELAAWAERHGIFYLDGRICCFPATIGRPDAVIYYGGDAAIFEAHRDTLVALAGQSIYAGADVTNPTKLDSAFLSYCFAAPMAMLYGAAICEAAGLDPDLFFTALPSFSGDVNRRAVSFREAIRARDYTNVQSALQTDLAGARMWLTCASELGVDPRFAQALLDLMKVPVDQGKGALDTAYLVEVFKGAKAG